MTAVESLFSESENYTRRGWYTLGIAEKEPPKGYTWTDKKGTVADEISRQIYFCNNQDVKRLAILLDSNRFGFALDIDGAKAMFIFQRKILFRYSQSLQDKINSTTRTKTANDGYHWLFEIQRKDFPNGIPQKRYWVSKQNKHWEIKIIGTNQYLIERGPGYESIRSIESSVTLSKDEANEFLAVLDTFDKETKTILNVSSKLMHCYYRSNRQNLALRVSGYLHRHHVPEYLSCDLVELLIETTGDEEPLKRKRAVMDTYMKDAETDKVSGQRKLLEAVDGDESVITTINQEFGKLGYHFDGNGHAMTKQVEQKEKDPEQKPRIEYVQKYSKTEDVLAEAIIIGQRAWFAVADFSDTNNAIITLEESIELDDGRKTVLKPLDSVSYLNKPYYFKSKQEFWDFIEKAKKETLDSICKKTKAIWKKYVDADDFHHSICSADTIFTHKQDRVGTTHYVFFVGDNDSGKSANLTIFEYLAYRCMASVGLTYANIYQFLGSRDEGVGTICEDEADNIDEDHDKMRLYKSGYTKGKVVPKTDTSFGRTQYKFNAYCFKAFAAEKLPDPVIAKGFLQRTIELKCVAGFPDEDISEVISPGDDEHLQRLLDELTELRNLIFCHCRLLHYKDKIPDIKLNIRNREKQLFKPVLRVFHGTETFNELLPVISRYVTQKREAKVNSYHAFLYRLVKDLIIAQETTELESNSIWSNLKCRVDWKEIPSKPQSIDTVEFGQRSQKEVVQTLKDVFNAKPPKRHATSRKLVFDLQVLEKMGKVYDVDVEIKVHEGEPQDGTHGTHGTHVGLDRHITDQDEDTENAEKKEENSEKHTETTVYNNKTEDPSDVDSHSYLNNVSQASQASQMPKSSSERYQTEETNSKAMCPIVCHETKRSWQRENRGWTQEEAQRFRDEVERLKEETAKKSKVAEMAEANQAGNGVMFGSKEEQWQK